MLTLVLPEYKSNFYTSSWQKKLSLHGYAWLTINFQLKKNI
jgi:hypothetical protein